MSPGFRRCGVCMTERKVCGIVVTFHPRPEDLENIAKLRPQVQGLAVVDNGSSEEKRNLLRIASRECDFTLIENGGRGGIATALNIGVKWAQVGGLRLGGAVRSRQHSPARLY